MLNVADIRRQVERAIETDSVIKKGLQQRIINSRALDRYILEANGVDSTLDAILGIVRRYPLGSENDNRHRQARGTKGIIAKISTELALNDVNLVGIICNSPEDILLVTEADAPRALEALQRM